MVLHFSSLGHIIPNYSPLCYCGCALVRTMAHIWQSCPRVSRLWIRVDALLRTLLHCNLKRNPNKGLLHKPIDFPLCLECQLAAHLFTTTKLTIVRAWKSPTLSFKAVKHFMNDNMVNEKADGGPSSFSHLIFNP